MWRLLYPIFDRLSNLPSEMRQAFNLIQGKDPAEHPTLPQSVSDQASGEMRELSALDTDLESGPVNQTSTPSNMVSFKNKGLQERVDSLQNTNRRYRDRITQGNEELRSMKKRLEDITAKYDEITEVAQDLHQKLLRSKTAEQSVTEQLRRQTELLNTAHKDLGDALNGNQELLLKVKTLEASTDLLSDDEVKSILHRLCHDLEHWVQCHFLPLKPAPLKNDNHSLQVDPTLLFFEIWASVLESIYGTFLNKTMVGSNPQFDTDFFFMDWKVHQLCPSHVAQQWRAATSTAVFSLGARILGGEYAGVISKVEKNYGHHSRTAWYRWKGDLRRLLGEFVELKRKLQCQVDTYCFEWVTPGSPFNPDTMTSFTGTCEEFGVIQCTLFPGLSKTKMGHEPILLEKAIIKPVKWAQEPKVEDTDNDETDEEEARTQSMSKKEPMIKKESMVKKEPVVKKEHGFPMECEAEGEGRSTREKRAFKKDDSKIENGSRSKIRVKMGELPIRENKRSFHG
ncbi:hypothetical protein N7493_005950 [Penicillium malachiteum]|uniref:Uncharacterized protein n=1 Tax=Penicillium malachiteum TaxID=1324776 RepID=A0AAD6HLJ3_9EURO|nr:hypothetical protein N7493_005950 [Penicillium malachiteum]